MPRKPEHAVYAAAAIFAVYGFAVVLHSATAYARGEALDILAFGRAVVRCAGMVVIAEGLIRRARWAWWVGVGLPVLLLIAALTAIGFTFILPDRLRLDLSAASAIIPIVALGSAVWLLLRRDVRELFRVRAGASGRKPAFK